MAFYGTRSSGWVDDNLSLPDSEDEVYDSSRRRGRGDRRDATEKADMGPGDLLKSLRVPMEGSFVYKTNKKREKTHHVYFSYDQLNQAAEIPSRLIPIKIDVEVDGIQIHDTFVWNANEKLITPEDYARILVDDLLVAGDVFRHEFPTDRETVQLAHKYLLQSINGVQHSEIPPNTKQLLIRHIESAIVSQVASAHLVYGDDEDIMPPQPQLPLDYLSHQVWNDGATKAHSSLESIKDMTTDFTQEQREALQPILQQQALIVNDMEIKATAFTTQDTPEINYIPGVEDEVRLIVKLDVTSGPLRFTDKIEYPLYSNHPPLVNTPVGQTALTTPESFAKVLCQEMGLSSTFVPDIAWNIRFQIMQARLSATHGLPEGIDESSNVILNQSIPWGFRLDPMPNPTTGVIDEAWEPTLSELTVEDVERIRKEAERGHRRARREVRVRMQR